MSSRRNDGGSSKLHLVAHLAPWISSIIHYSCTGTRKHLSKSVFLRSKVTSHPSSSVICPQNSSHRSILTLFRLSTTSASTIDFTFPFELLFVLLLLLPCIIKLVCLINFRAFGDSLRRSERGTVGCWDGSLFDKFISGHILWISLIPSLTVDRLCILSSACSGVGTVVVGSGTVWKSDKTRRYEQQWYDKLF